MAHVRHKSGLRGHSKLGNEGSLLLRSLFCFLIRGIKSLGCCVRSDLLASFCSAIGLFLLGLEEGSSCLLIVGYELQTTHEGSKSFRNSDTLGSLVILKDAAHGSSSGTHRSVDHVDIDLLVSVH